MLDTHPTEEEKAGGNRNIVLEKNNENSMGEASKQRWSLKENGPKNTTYAHNQEETFLGYIIWKEGLETLTITGFIKIANKHSSINQYESFKTLIYVYKQYW